MTSTAPQTPAPANAPAHAAARPLVLTHARLGAGGPAGSPRVEGGRTTSVVPAGGQPPVRAGDRVPISTGAPYCPACGTPTCT
jgi:hypothetical protein